MSMGNKFNVLDSRFNYSIITKMKDSGNETLAMKQADFKYMLFNYHTNRFQVKTSSESRLFHFKSLHDLGSVLNDLKEAITSCIKRP